jgi:hypothetical protein
MLAYEIMVANAADVDIESIEYFDHLLSLEVVAYYNQTLTYSLIQITIRRRE